MQRPFPKGSIKNNFAVPEVQLLSEVELLNPKLLTTEPYGIIIRMYYAPKEHPPPHFHVYYGDHKATIDIRTCEVIQGNLPRKKTKLVLAWAELHQDELMADWVLVMNGEELFKIQPLQ